MRTNTALSFEGIRSSRQTLFGADLHAKRVLSLAGATLGVIQSASLAVAMIGQGLALARGRTTKHATKQVDRMLANQGIDIELAAPLGTTSWAAGPASRPRWIGLISRPTARRRSCCRC